MTDPAPANPSEDAVFCIVGAGSIGTSFAVLHAMAGRAVTLFDLDRGAMRAAEERIATTLADLLEHGLLDEEPARVASRVALADDLESAVSGARFVHECVSENLELKARLTADIDRLADREAVIGSASSAIPASEYARDIPGRARCLVTHPGNPPFLLRVVEIVPASFTDPEATERARAILEASGLETIIVRKELRGFVFNRLQGALLREAYCLVRDGVVDVDEIDAIVRDGLGLRWSVIGPFETVDLNTRGGIERHARLLGPAYEAMGAERGQHDPWTDDLIASVTAQRRALLPMPDWEARVRWRDRAIMRTLASRAGGSER
ncbi:MAG: 3-hydroxyacyl-CoA dehydrogenase [Pseudomonadota bacterium]